MLTFKKKKFQLCPYALLSVLHQDYASVIQNKFSALKVLERLRTLTRGSVRMPHRGFRAKVPIIDSLSDRSRLIGPHFSVHSAIYELRLSCGFMLK